MTPRMRLLLGGIGVITILGGLEEQNNGYVKADFGISLAIGIISSVAGKVIYDGFFRDFVNNEAARHTQDIRDRQCAQAFPTYNPDTGIYRDKWGNKHICPYLK